MIQGVRLFMKISDLLTPEDLATLTSSLGDFPASRSALPENGLAPPTVEEICSLSLPESLKTNDLAILYLRMFPDCWGLRKGKPFARSLQRFPNWGIAWNGWCMTAPASACHRRGGESILQDVLESTVPEKYWLSEKAMRKIAGKLNS